MLFCTASAMAQTGEYFPVLHAGGYGQIQDAGQGFELRRLRPFLTASMDSLTLFGEAQVGKNTIPLQVYLEYRMTLPILGRSKLRLGQFTNPMMQVESSPGKKRFVAYALTDYYITDQYDIGVSILFANRLGSFQSCVFNGSGHNVPDDNQSRDFTASVTSSWIGPLRLSGAFQSGRQPPGERTLYYGKLSVCPASGLSVESAMLWRRDFQHSRGWLVTAVADLNESFALTARCTQRTQFALLTMAQEQLVTDDVEVVVGAELRQGALKFQPNLVLQQHSHPTIIWSVQFDLN
ncbi:MAG: hypothetical protein WCW66_04880 [Patescibacteria group bacterium]